MSDKIIEALPIGVVVVIAIVFAVAFIAVFVAVMNEAERKLGREPRLIEFFLIAITMPYSGAYVFFVMQDQRRDGGSGHG